MTLHRLFLLSFVFIFTHCTSVQDRPDDPTFKELTNQFFKEFWQLHPSYGSSVGLHQYDAILELPTVESRNKKLEFYSKYLARFTSVAEDDLSFSQRTDKQLILTKLKKSVWDIQDFKAYQWQLDRYNLGPAINSVLNKTSRSLEDRLKDLSEKLLNVASFYEVTKANVVRPTKEHLQLAIKQTKGLQNYLSKKIPKKVKNSKLSRREKSTLKQRLQAAATATRKYRQYLNDILSHPSKVGGFRSFRIGAEQYKKKFEYDLQIESTPEELYKKALAAKEEIRSKMFEIAIALYPDYFGAKLPPKDRQRVIAQVIGKVSRKHPKPKDFVETVRKQIPELRKFISENDILTLDPKKPLRVKEMPSYLRGYAGALVDSPGPYDKFRETYYYVSPLDDMSKKQQQSYLREYNDYTLQILNIHEAIPGHYAQLVYSNQSSSLVKSIFGNGPTIEGWAVYTERMMLEQGYGNGSKELWLMYYKWFLRVVTNTILDYEIHNKNLTQGEAMKMMTVDAFQEKAEAEGKWTRATVSQVQLASYFAGFSEIYALREKVKKEESDDFNLKSFHETFLSFGSAPVKEIKKLML